MVFPTLPGKAQLSYPDSVQYLYSLGNEIKAGAKLGPKGCKISLAGLGHPDARSVSSM